MATKVALRRRPISKGRDTLYLEYYPAVKNNRTGKYIHSETLGIYVYQNPRNPEERRFNNEMLTKAEAIRGDRFLKLLNEDFGFFDKAKSKLDFLEYFREVAQRKYSKWLMVYAHFERFVGGHCEYGDVTVSLCMKFRDYLLTAKQLRNPKLTIKRNSASGYFATFMALLKIAYREKVIRENICVELNSIKWEDVKKEYLNMDELRKLSETPCEFPVLKSASLFACFTGLRLGDILSLEWSNIVPATEGGFCMRIKTGKTGCEATLPLSDEALELCGTRGEGIIFKGFERYMAQYPLKKWLSQAGITRNITFHCFRHTYATLQIALGTDIFTVSKMLTHKFVSTTQVYTALVDEKKRKAANLITLK